MSSESENLLKEIPSSAEEKQRGEMGFEKASASWSDGSQENLAAPMSDMGFSPVEVLIKSEIESADPLVCEQTSVENVWLPDESCVKTETESFWEPPDVDISVDIKPSNECIQDASVDIKLCTENMNETSVCKVESVSDDNLIHFEDKTQEVPCGENVPKSEGFYPGDHGQFVNEMPAEDGDNSELILSEDKDMKYSVENLDEVEDEVADCGERYLNNYYMKGHSQDVPRSVTLLPSGELSEQEQAKDNREGNFEPGPSAKYSKTKADKGFARKADCNVHVRYHTKERPFKCSICNKDFTQRSYLNSHIRVHTKERPFKCSICNKDFTWRSYLFIHKRVHTKERPYKCSICNKGFIQKCNLDIHMRVHTKEKPFNCSICGKGFARRESYNCHVFVHSKERPFKCSVCDKEFVHKGGLNMHMRVHTKEKPFKCSICNKEFARKDILNMHMRVHTKEKPFNCSICGKGFASRQHCNRHVLIHNKERPFKCSVCDKDFVYKGSLNTHMRVHTKEYAYEGSHQGVPIFGVPILQYYFYYP